MNHPQSQSQRFTNPRTLTIAFTLPTQDDAIGQKVVYSHFIDPQYKHELYTGAIMAVKHHPLYGTQYHIQPDEGQSMARTARWCAWHQVKQYVFSVQAEIMGA